MLPLTVFLSPEQLEVIAVFGARTNITDLHPIINCFEHALLDVCILFLGISQHGFNLFKYFLGGLRCVKAKRVTIPREPDVPIRDHLVDRVVLGPFTLASFKVLHLAQVNAVKSNQGPFLEHMLPAQKLAQKSASSFKNLAWPNVEAEKL